MRMGCAPTRGTPHPSFAALYYLFNDAIYKVANEIVPLRAERAIETCNHDNYCIVY